MCQKRSQPALLENPKTPSDPPAGSESPEQGAWPPVPLTSLDDSEITDDLRLKCTHAQRRIHRAWQDERTRIVYAFASSGDEKLLKRSYTIASCCCSPMIMQQADGSVGVCPIRCRDRLCPLCALRRAKEAAVKYGAAVAEMDAARHLVLTAPAVDAPLAEQLRELKAALRRLRQQKCWKEHVRGGCYTIEVTRNKRSGLWHPHLHLIIDGSFFPHHKIMDAWRSSLRSGTLWPNLAPSDSVIVHISAVHNRKQLARYIAKYIAKPTELCSWPLRSLCEYAKAVVGLRMMHTFGTLHGVKLGVDDANETHEGSRTIMGIAELDWKALNGIEEAQQAVALIRSLWPHTSLWFGCEHDPGLAEWAAKLEGPTAELKGLLAVAKQRTCNRGRISNQIKPSINNRKKNNKPSKYQPDLFEIIKV